MKRVPLKAEDKVKTKLQLSYHSIFEWKWNILHFLLKAWFHPTFPRIVSSWKFLLVSGRKFWWSIFLDFMDPNLRRSALWRTIAIGNRIKLAMIDWNINFILLEFVMRQKGTHIVKCTFSRQKQQDLFVYLLGANQLRSKLFLSGFQDWVLTVNFHFQMAMIFPAIFLVEIPYLFTF